MHWPNGVGRARPARRAEANPDDGPHAATAGCRRRGHITARKGSVNLAAVKSWEFDLDGGAICHGGFLSLIAKSTLF